MQYREGQKFVINEKGQIQFDRSYADLHNDIPLYFLSKWVIHGHIYPDRKIIEIVDISVPKAGQTLWSRDQEDRIRELVCKKIKNYLAPGLKTLLEQKAIAPNWKVEIYNLDVEEKKFKVSEVFASSNEESENSTNDYENNRNALGKQIVADYMARQDQKKKFKNKEKDPKSWFGRYEENNKFINWLESVDDRPIKMIIKDDGTVVYGNYPVHAYIPGYHDSSYVFHGFIVPAKKRIDITTLNFPKFRVYYQKHKMLRQELLKDIKSHLAPGIKYLLANNIITPDWTIHDEITQIPDFRADDLIGNELSSQELANKENEFNAKRDAEGKQIVDDYIARQDQKKKFKNKEKDPQSWFGRYEESYPIYKKEELDRFCGWCNKKLNSHNDSEGPVIPKNEQGSKASHGICNSCIKTHFPDMDEAVNYNSGKEVIIKKDEVLYHGTAEHFDTRKIQTGPDDVFWTADNPLIARSYIPNNGSYSNPTLDHILKDEKLCKSLGITDKIRMYAWKENNKGYEKVKYWDDVKKELEAKSKEIEKRKDWGNPLIGEIWEKWEEAEKNYKKYQGEWKYWDHYLKKFLKAKLNSLGYEVDEWGRVKRLIEDKDGNVLPASTQTIGKVLKVICKRDFKFYNYAYGREGDLMDLDYHKISLFEKIEEMGYDGIIINDFAQTMKYGNYGHRSIGFFKKSLPDLQIKQIRNQSHPKDEEW